jgi:hypothetical protein
VQRDRRVLSGRGWIAVSTPRTLTVAFRSARAAHHLTVNDIEQLAGSPYLVPEIHLLWKTAFPLAAEKSGGRPFRVTLRRTFTVEGADRIDQPWRRVRQGMARS